MTTLEKPKVTPTLATGEFYELPEHQTEVFTKLFADEYREQYHRVAVLDHEGKRYIAAANGYIAILFPCTDTMPLGNYKGLPYMKSSEPGVVKTGITGLLNQIKDFTAYQVSVLPETDDDIFFSELSYYESRASLGGEAVFVGRVEDGKFTLTDTPPEGRSFDNEQTDWILSAKNVTFIADHIGVAGYVQVSGTRQMVVFHNAYNGAIAILMPMREFNLDGIKILFKR